MKRSHMVSRVSLFVALGLVALLATAASAASYTWDDGGADSYWMTAANWDSDYTGSGYDDGDDFTISSGTAITVDGAWFVDSLTVNGTGTLQMGNSVGDYALANALTLAGGTMSRNLASNGVFQNALNITAASTINNSGTGNLTFVGTLTGSGDINKTGTGSLELATNSGSTWSGKMTINGGKVRLAAAGAYLGTGTIEVDADEFEMHGGFWDGQVDVLAGGVAEFDQMSAPLINLHLKGGTLRKKISFGNITVGHGTGSTIYVDSASTISNDNSGTLSISAVLTGAGTLAVDGGGTVQLTSLDISSTYSGNWDIQSGKVFIRNDLSSSDATTYLGSGAAVNVAAGATLEMGPDYGAFWSLTKDVTGSGLVQMSADDQLIITRNAANTAGGISPGNSAGILTFDLKGNTAGTAYGTLNFAQNVSGDNAQVIMEIVGVGGVAGVDFDQIALTHDGSTYAHLLGLENVDLIVDLTGLAVGADPGVVTILTGCTDDLSGITELSFGSVTFLGGSGTVLGTSGGEIQLSGIQAIPEPATMGLLVIGGIGALLRRRRR